MFFITQFEPDRFGVVYGIYPYHQLESVDTYTEFEQLVRSGIQCEYPNLTKIEFKNLQLLMHEMHDPT